MQQIAVDDRARGYGRSGRQVAGVVGGGGAVAVDCEVLAEGGELPFDDQFGTVDGSPASGRQVVGNGLVADVAEQVDAVGGGDARVVVRLAADSTSYQVVISSRSEVKIAWTSGGFESTSALVATGVCSRGSSSRS